ncbi:MAG: amidohydrolase [Spirochaetota bacterium]
MKTLITNAVIIPVEGSEPYWFNGSIGIEEGKISFLGSTPDYFTPDRIIDATDCIAIPGLINAHNHLSMTLLRNYADDMDLFTWLREKIWPIEHNMGERQIYWGSLLGIAEQIRSGVTAFADMYFLQEQTINAVLETGVRAAIGATFMGDKQETLSRLPAVRELYSSFSGAGEGRITIDMAPHAVYTCTRESLELIAQTARELDTRIHIHLSETTREVDECIDEHGKTPPAYLAELGLFSSPVYAAHCVDLRDNDYDLLLEHSVYPVHCPTSNMKLGSGFAALGSWLELGIKPALGTDGASSNNNLNMFEEMHMASVIHKGFTKEPTAVTAYEVLQMATVNGAKALGKEGSIGSLQPGKDADIVLVDCRKPHLQPLHNPISSLVYSAQASDVKTVFCQGKPVLENGQLTSIDEEQVLHEAGTAARTLFS